MVAVFSAERTEVGEGIFTLLELRACEESEFGPDAVFANGDRVWTNGAGLILRDQPGPAHCGWQLARFLHIGEGVDSRQYIGDPVGVLPTTTLVEPYDGDAPLPRTRRRAGTGTATSSCGSCPTGVRSSWSAATVLSSGRAATRRSVATEAIRRGTGLEALDRR